MKTQSILLALAAAPAVLAHTAFTDFYIDGQAQGDAVAMRMRKDPPRATDPINDLTSNDMACNVDGSEGVSRVQSVRDGATLTFEFRSWANDPSQERMDRGHKGPCAIYLKKVESAINDPGHGDGWFKIFDDGYDASNDQWCTDKLLDNNGLFSIALPKGLAAGYYLARPEILALHAANNGNPQFYTGCAQIFLESSGDLVPESTVSIPGYVNAGDDNMNFDIYNRDNSEYKMHGPSVAKLTSGSGVATGGDSQTSQSEGQRPEGCICENGNWCGKEVSDYSDETGCWASGKQCWDQLTACYDAAGPTGSAGCKVWEEKCNGIQTQCYAGNFQGPPNKGKDLTPQKKTIDVGLVFAAEVQGGNASPAKVEVKSSAAPVVEAKSSAPAPVAEVKETSKASSQAPVATPTPTPSPVNNNNEAEAPAPVETPKQTTIDVTIPASEGAPAPTQAVCPPGFECVTEYHTATKTVIVYETVAPKNHRNGRNGHRNGHRGQQRGQVRNGFHGRR